MILYNLFIYNLAFVYNQQKRIKLMNLIMLGEFIEKEKDRN